MSDIPASLYRKGRATQVNIEALQELIAERDAAMESVEAQLDALRTGKMFQLRKKDPANLDARDVKG